MIKKIIIFIILLSTFSLAATVKGTIYDEGLNKINNVIVEVDSTPKQRVIAKDGFYSLNLPKGSYIITATYQDLKAEEKITINQEGTFNLDLFLFPSFEEETLLLEESNIDIEEIEKQSLLPFIILIIIFLATAIGLYIGSKKLARKFQSFLDDDLTKVLEIIKKHGKRTTQKEIRKELGLSEAKISLLITELESLGKVRKIKKGRGNIIILNEKSK